MLAGAVLPVVPVLASVASAEVRMLAADVWLAGLAELSCYL